MQIGTIYVYVYVYLYIYMNIHMYYDEGSWERLRKLGGWFELQLSGGLTGGRVFELMLMISTAFRGFRLRVFQKQGEEQGGDVGRDQQECPFCNGRFPKVARG